MVDLEAVGGAATGGLIAGQFEKPAGAVGEHHGHCADCGTETLGRFCYNCGNPSHVHRTLLHLGEELLHGVMHFDSRAWRTLPMLVFRPGRLTREWVLGKRSRYVSPLALFLFTVFVMFMALSMVPVNGSQRSMADARADIARDVQRETARVARREADVKAAPVEGRARAAERLAHARQDLTDVQARQKALEKLAASGSTGVGWQQMLGTLDFKTGDKVLDEKLKHKLENPELLVYKLQQTFYKFSFLLVPISIPFVAALFLWKRGFSLYDHGVFILYSLTFVSLTAMLIALGSTADGDAGDLIVLGALFAVPTHMFFQLKGAYGLRIFSALWRTFVLLNFCAIALSLFVAAVIRLGFA